MSQSCEAIYEKGVFRPLNGIPATLTEGQRVHLVVEVGDPAEMDLLQLAAQVYRGLSEEQVREIEHITLERRDLFDRTGS